MPTKSWNTILGDKLVKIEKWEKVPEKRETRNWVCFPVSPKHQRKLFDGAFKARVVLEVLRGEKTLSEIASEYEIHTNQIVTRKKQSLNVLLVILSRKIKNSEKQKEEEMQDELYKKIGELKVENEFKKKLGYSREIVVSLAGGNPVG